MFGEVVCVQQVELSRFHYILKLLKSFHLSGGQKHVHTWCLLSYRITEQFKYILQHAFLYFILSTSGNLCKPILKLMNNVFQHFLWLIFTSSAVECSFFYSQSAHSWDDPGGWRISTGCHSGIQQTARTKPVRPLIAKFMALFEARGEITFSSSPHQGSLRLERDSREGSNRTPVIACRGWHL